MPDQQGLAPSYDQKSFENDFGCSDMILVASKSGRNGTVKLNQDVEMYAAKAQNAGEKEIKTFKHRHLWVQVISGEISVDGVTLEAGDGAGIEQVENLKLKWAKGTEFILFDMP